ncbi:MAG: 50S ribosomal protein L4 [Acidobacteria bacterium]|jgi:large subunit ribosomal protein L4|nr:50S ribosomal protein L4 [Acidobacteriota bacterium]
MSDVFTLRGPVRKERPEPARRSVARRSLSGAELSTVALEPTIFGLEPNVAVMHQVVKAQLAARRAGTQSTKTRKEVSGGGKKPFSQKGTGGARQGTIRAPHYPGGGIALGPKPRSYEQRTPKKMVRLALYSALSDRASEERVALIDGFAEWTTPKTATAAAALATLGLTGKVLVVVTREDTVARLAFRNLPNVLTIDAGEINTYDVLNSDWVLFTDASLPSAKESN